MRAILTISVLTLVLAVGCNNGASDAEIRQKVPGSWTPDWNPDFLWKMERSNSNKFSLLDKRGGEAVGRWQVDSGILLITMTNKSWANYRIQDQRYRVIHIDDHEMRLLAVGADKGQTLHR